MPAPRGCGGIGRRARFRSVWGQPRGGSSPLIRIDATAGRSRLATPEWYGRGLRAPPPSPAWPSLGAGRVTFVAASLAGAGIVAAVAGFLPTGAGRVFALAVAAFTLLVWAFLGALSIGILVAPSAFLAFVARHR